MRSMEESRYRRCRSGGREGLCVGKRETLDEMA